MTNKLRDLLRNAENWPQDAQDALADTASDIAAGLEGDYRATPEELAAIDRGLADAQHGRFASDTRLQRALGQFRRSRKSFSQIPPPPIWKQLPDTLRPTIRR
jgi:predicted transcriptional regulator